jgi:hypothetical protein
LDFPGHILFSELVLGGHIFPGTIKGPVLTRERSLMGMFEYSTASWTTFLTVSILLNLSPGPDMAFSPGQTARRGVQANFSAMSGIGSGAFSHVILAALELSAVLATSDSGQKGIKGFRFSPGL